MFSDQSGQQLLVFSIEFLRKGKVDTFAFILQCIKMAFVTGGGHICDDSAQAQSDAARVFAGRFVYHCNSELLRWRHLHCRAAEDIDCSTPSAAEAGACRPRIGPRFKFKSRPPHAGDDQGSTMSNSKRSSANQVRFSKPRIRPGSDVFFRRLGAYLPTSFLSRICRQISVSRWLAEISAVWCRTLSTKVAQLLTSCPSLGQR